MSHNFVLSIRNSRLVVCKREISFCDMVELKIFIITNRFISLPSGYHIFPFVVLWVIVENKFSGPSKV